MIYGFFHDGSGLGNQLFRYVATRTIAEDKGFEWGMANPEKFKGHEFMPLTMGRPVEENMEYHQFREKKILEGNLDVRGYDPEVNFITDWTAIDGEFQDQQYWGHRLAHIRDWLSVKPLIMEDDVCVIGFRGGEYTLFPELFLTKEYWELAIDRMLKNNPHMTFEVHTDDKITAQQFFPHFPCIQNIEQNWRAVRYARNLIIANSSFYILPALLNTNVDEIIAPRYWARRNEKIWALPQNYYKRFTYL